MTTPTRRRARRHHHLRVVPDEPGPVFDPVIYHRLYRIEHAPGLTRLRARSNDWINRGDAWLREHLPPQTVRAVQRWAPSERICRWGTVLCVSTAIVILGLLIIPGPSPTELAPMATDVAEARLEA